MDIHNSIMDIPNWIVYIHNYLIHRSITPTPYMVLPLIATWFAAYAGGIRVSFIQPRLF